MSSSKSGRRLVDAALVLLILFSLVPALWIARVRWRVEKANQQVSVILDGVEMDQVSGTSGLPLPEVLSRFRQAGATAVGIGEETFAELIDTSRAQVVLAERGRLSLLLSEKDGSRVYQALSRRLPGSDVRMARTVRGTEISLRGSLADLKDFGLGLPEDRVALAKASGLEVVARIANSPFAYPSSIQDTMAQARKVGARLVIFDKEEILGYEVLLKETARQMREQGLLYGWVEFAPQKGDDLLRRSLSDQLLLVHSIPLQELLTMKPSTAALRYSRAARERNVRACYVHLFVHPQKDLLKSSLDYVRMVSSLIRKEGFALGRGQPFEQRTPRRVLRLLILLGVAAAGALLLGRLAPLAQRDKALTFLLFLLVLAILVARKGSGGWNLAALASACFLPSLGVIVTYQRLGSGEHSDSSGRSLLRALGGFFACSLASVVGGLLVVGLLSDPSYLVKVSQFAGVKIAHLFPLAVVGFVVLAEVGGEAETWRSYRERIVRKIGRLLARPVLVFELLLGLIALAGIAIYLLRTGNQPPVPVSGGEMRFRELLEHLLYARPRTKEFLIGHPALILSFVLSLRGKRGWAGAFLLWGAIGQLSILNSFCHIHSPLAITLARVGNGIWLGALIGIIAATVWGWAWQLRRRRLQPGS